MKITLAFACLLGLFAFAHAGVKISAFNIQILGPTKMSKPDVVAELVKIIRRYDLVVIQEIRNADGTAIVKLLDEVNNAEGAANYDMEVGPRVGRTSSKEQYCYMYRKAVMTPSGGYTYNDVGDKFEREPFNLLFSISGVGTIAFSALHAKPDDAVNELNVMVNVYDDVSSHYGTSDVILLGDFNADCSYVTTLEMSSLSLRTDSRLTWYIADTDDTTVSSTDCAYDRFVVDNGLIGKIKSTSIFNFETAYGLTNDFARDVSDHYPIEIEFY